MDSRIQRIEERLMNVEAELAIIKANYVTRGDLRREIGTLTWRLVTFVSGFGIALVGGLYIIAAHAS